MTWTVSDVMSKVEPARDEELVDGDVLTTSPSTPLTTAASLMFEHRVQELPVIDSEHRLIGTVHRSAILRVFLRGDEAIRREIVRDLLEIQTPGPMKVGVEVVDGVVHLYGKADPGSSTEALRALVVGTPGVVAVQIHLELAGERSPQVAEPTRFGAP